MAKQSENKEAGLVPAQSYGLSNAPAFLGDERETGVSIPEGELIVPMAVIVQKTSEIVDSQGQQPGLFVDLLTLKPLLDFAGKKAPKTTRVTPLCHFMSWIEWAPLDKGGGVVDATNDPNHALAQAARALKKGRDGKLLVTSYHNFFMLFHDHLDTDGVPIVRLVRFFRTSYKAGKNLLMLITDRRRPLYSGVYDLGLVFKEKGSDRKWYEHTIANSAQNPWVEDEAQFQAMKALHDKWKASLPALNLEKLVVDDDAVADDGLGTPADVERSY